MAYALEFDYDRRTVVVTFTDAPTLEEALQVLRGLPSHAQFIPRCGILVDLRALPPVTTDAEGIRRFVHFHAGHPDLRSCAAAVLTGRAVHFGLANMYATLCGFRGVTVGAFQSVETAQVWLDERTSAYRTVV